MVPMTRRRQTEAEAAATLRAILAAVERGELAATTPQAIALVRRIEGATTALEQSAKPPPKLPIDAREPLR